MAEAVVISALKKLADVAVLKGLELYEVHDQIEPMQSNLRFIQAFLKDADQKQSTNASVKEWVSQVRELAYRIGRAVEILLAEIEEDRSTSPPPAGNGSSCGCFSRAWTVAKHPRKLNTVSGEFKEISKEMKRISETRIQLGILDLGCGSELVPAAHDQLPFRPTKPIHIDDSEVVGFDSDQRQIISHLLDTSVSRRTVLSIVGVGGLGKTTLAQKVYKSTQLSAEFSCRTWLSISQKFDENNLCRQILYSIEPTMKEKNPCMTDEDLWEELVKHLSSKRYLIILDDVWTVDLWERLKVALPDTKNASRVIITTRDLEVAKAADSNTKAYKLGYLTKDESLALLFGKALQQHDIQPDKYPPSLIEVANQLIKKCGRLPLALVVLGRLLSTKDRTYAAWKRVYNTLDWHSNHGKKCSQILRMSYQELCYEKKQCFMYFAAFPEDHVISAKHITRMWIAEGLIPVEGEGTLEDRAEDYLEELVNRCLVQAVERSWSGYCKYCSMHDLLRDLAIHEAKEENFFTVFSKHEDGNQLATKEPHRVALQFHSPIGYAIHLTNIHSLLSFGASVLNYQGFTQLRVLVLEQTDMSKIKIGKNWLQGSVHLRYLGFRNCYGMSEEFENISFGAFKNLETFDCKGTLVRNNHSIWEVPTLRHVITSSTNDNIPCPLNWDNLKNLQTLKWVDLVDIPKIESNVNLRTLKISFSWQHLNKSFEKCSKALQAFLSRTEHLESLAIRDSGLMLFLSSGIRELPCHKTMHKLYLDGQWESPCVPSLEMFPKNLTKLKLSRSNLKEDPMPVLERLQCLRILQLRRRSYEGKKMICSAGGFPSLQKLELEGLIELREWEIKQGAMPSLSQLKIQSCNELCLLPEQLNVPSLRELIVSLDLDSKLANFFQNAGTKEIIIHDLLKSTSNFDQANIIGCGEFGLVYKACLQDGSKVAVKKISGDCSLMERDFRAEVEVLSRARHPNLVSLKGYCVYGSVRLLIYSYMENGSLNDWLHERPNGGSQLKWPLRLKIAQDSARGLSYLHKSCDPTIIHRSVKSSNILLDEKFEAHLGDFGLSRFMNPDATHVTTDVVGMLGYTPPEYGQARIATLRGDVYSFGVVLLELLTGRRVVEFCRAKGSRELVSWVCQMRKEKKEETIFDSLIWSKLFEKELMSVLEVACKCINYDPRLRPGIEQVVAWLDEVGVDE